MKVCPVIFLNGPPQCGKDTLAGHIVHTTPGFRLMKFAKVLKERTHALYGCPSNITHDYFEDVKDKPNPIFHGLSPRHAYISVSERLMKPVHGADIWGKILLSDLLYYLDESRAYVISDSGYTQEAFPIIDRFGADNCLLIRIHADKKGCTFKGDSRSHIQLPIESFDLHNDGTINDFLCAANNKLTYWLQSLMGGT